MTQVQRVFLNQIDLAKLEKADNSQFLLRLMIALNDLLSIQYLQQLVDADSKLRPAYDHIQSGAHGYLLRMQSSALVEIYEAFVKRFHEQKPPIKRIHQKHPEVGNNYKRLAKLCNEPKMAELQSLRNQFGFHYNFEQQGATTKAALARIIAEQLSIGETRPLGYIQIGDPEGWESFRFVLGDQVVYTAWRDICGKIPFSTTGYENCPFLQELKDYVRELARAFIAWSMAIIQVWIDDNRLKLGNAIEVLEGN